jgi:nucleoredoxin
MRDECLLARRTRPNLRAMKTLLIIGMAALLANAVAAAPLAETLKGDLVSLSGKRTHRFDDATLANTKYFAVYYSASWCGPCRAFTPKLVEWYNKNKPAHADFELIFVSSDQGEAEMDEYMATDKMPWPALKFTKKAANKSVTKYAGPGIPCLVFLDAEGKVLSDSYVRGSYVGPQKVLADIEKTLGAGAASAPAATAGTTTSSGLGGSGLGATTGATKPKSTQGSNFDDFFKKKTPSQ